MKPRIEQLSIRELQKRLGILERKYGMTSAEFETKYRQGAMGDSEEVMSWIRDYESYKILLSKEQRKKKAVGA